MCTVGGNFDYFQYLIYFLFAACILYTLKLALWSSESILPPFEGSPPVGLRYPCWLRHWPGRKHQSRFYLKNLEFDGDDSLLYHRNITGIVHSA